VVIVELRASAAAAETASKTAPVLRHGYDKCVAGEAK
jgi:hypothetical protein